MPFLYAAIIALSALAGSWAADTTSEPASTLGAALPGATAVFETSLAAPITSSATSMTLAANSVRGGGSVSGYNCFTIDEGSAQAEFVCGTVSSTNVTALTRGISTLTGTTTDSDLQFAHRRGANVKITDFPLIQILKAQANGEDTYPNNLSYAAGVVPTEDQHIVDKEYVDDLAFNGASVIDASATARGVVELATQLEAASSTPTGSTGPLVIPASSATSTYNSATAALRVLMTGNDGFISSSFLPNSITKAISFTNSLTLSGASASSNIASSSIVAFTASTTPTTTWTKPANLKYVHIRVIGGGGGSLNSSGGPGGGGGGYCEKVIPASALSSTVTVTVGNGGATAGGPSAPSGNASSFGSHCTANGGTGYNSSSGGAGGTATGGEINITGMQGGEGVFDSSESIAENGRGGASAMGSVGSGGSAGDAGQVGAVYVTQYFY